MDYSRWWLWSAGFVAAMMVLLGIGNFFGDDGGPLFGQIAFAAVLLGGAALVGFGIRTRPDSRARGSRMVAVGLLPGASGVALFWFPPAAAIGVLALATSVMAFRDSGGLAISRRAPIYTFSAVVATAVVLSLLAIGA